MKRLLLSSCLALTMLTGYVTVQAVRYQNPELVKQKKELLEQQRKLESKKNQEGLTEFETNKLYRINQQIKNLKIKMIG